MVPRDEVNSWLSDAHFDVFPLLLSVGKMLREGPNALKYREVSVQYFRNYFYDFNIGAQ